MESRGESRGVWVQLLKTVNGLADGTREWKNCVLAAARRPAKNTMASLVWPSTILLVEEMKSGNKQSPS